MLPTALPGIITGVMLAVARAAGETAPSAARRRSSASRSTSTRSPAPRRRCPLVRLDQISRGDRRSRPTGPGPAPSHWSLLVADPEPRRRRARSRTLTTAPSYREKDSPTMAKRIDVSDLDIYYGDFQAIEGVSMTSSRSRSPRSSARPAAASRPFLRSLNRMHEVTPGARVEGKVLLDGEDIYGPGVDPVDVRRTIGMVFQRPNPFPTMSIYDNVIAGPQARRRQQEVGAWTTSSRSRCGARTCGTRSRTGSSRPGAASPAASSSGSASPAPSRSSRRSLLMDEPCSALDPISTLAIEDLMQRAEGPLHDRHRHPQHAAGGPRLRPHRLLQHRRRPASPASSSRSTTPRRSSAPPASGRPRTTSPAASADLSAPALLR